MFDGNEWGSFFAFLLDLYTSKWGGLLRGKNRYSTVVNFGPGDAAINGGAGGTVVKWCAEVLQLKWSNALLQVAFGCFS